ncbi:LamG-like jellyroll fold domain-containing protein [Paenibacillus tarimensis]|uniref:LamG-like jellyroll fold domain-containing protein n=1 Tax=Paenibacillus tarimensis TaxID=416012 RepID=UPI001F45E382|nr:LamG-like jellyroll fold domain-containing protein [Paenibacillus tarimensis]MCF2946095.1 family 43 glycosylhydrolase [Paenibacillus tarimensis]
MSKRTVKNLTAVLLILTLIFPSAVMGEEHDRNINQGNRPGQVQAGEAPDFKNVSVHDPSIIKVNDTYYVFGSHIEAAKSKDLVTWTTFTNGYTTPNNVLYGDLSANLAESFEWAGEDDSDSKGGFAVWAPDVIWNPEYVNEDGTKGAYLMYYSASSTYIRSAIGLAVSKTIEGPYKYADTLIYSGFTRDEAYDANSDVNKQWENTNIKQLLDTGKIEGVRAGWFNSNGSYNNALFPNAIDANLFYDENGKLWMTYGSWSGGIFILEIDPATGKAIYPGKDGTTEDGRMIDRYFGTKISGGYYKSGEGPYVKYDESTGYYHLYVTYGWLGADGGYNMRFFRSESPTGPYVDSQGQNAVLPGDTDNAPYGNKLISNYLFDRKVGDPGTGIGTGYVSPGHNSVYYDEETGQKFLIFHSRFPQTGEMHELRVHEIFMTEDGWPVVAPYRYTGETALKVNKQDLEGDYKFINHGNANSAEIIYSDYIRLNKNNTVTGTVQGTWKKTGHYQAELTLDGVTYNGVFVRGWDPTSKQYVMTFAAVSKDGVSIWGSRQQERTDQEVVNAIHEELSLGDTSNVITNLKLPTVGALNAQISWTTSDASVVTDQGVVNRPEPGSGKASAVLTATITKGDVTASKAFSITVLPIKEAELAAQYSFEDNLSEKTGSFTEGTVTGNRIDNTGGTITFAEGKSGKAAVFNGESGVRLPNGLIEGSSYSVSLWLKPDQLTAFTTTFFGARDANNWISLVPSGPASNNTMVWSGSGRWYDAPAGLTIKAGEWSHVAFSVNNGVITLYVNGEAKFEGTNFPDIFTTDNGTFGLGVNWWDTPFKGQMDELLIFKGALTQDQVNKLATLSK